MNLILVESNEVSGAGDVTLTGTRADHLRQVLRVASGDTVRVGIIDGPCGVGTVQAVVDRTVTLRCVFESVAAPRQAIDLLLAVPRPKVMRRLWAQIAALGVNRILLTNAARVERNYFDTHILTPEWYRPLMIEGLQQARDTALPQVSIHRQLKVLVEDQLDELVPRGLRLVADPGADRRVAAMVQEQAEDRALLAIGPEGGWNGFEIELFRAHRFQAVGMGVRTLRSDTACVALLALVHDAMNARQIPRVR